MASATTTTQNPDLGYAILYDNIALLPGLARFRRFRNNWAKLVHDDAQEVHYYESQVREELQKIIPGLSAENLVGVTDIPRHEIRSKYPEIYKSVWKPYEKALRQHGRDLCMSSQIMQLPDQGAYETDVLSKYKPLIFTDGICGITQEHERYWLGPSADNDGCSWKEPESSRLDGLSERFIRVADWIHGHFFERSKSAGTPEESYQVQLTLPPRLRLQTLTEFMDYISCIFASALMMCALFALDAVKLPKGRIALVGCLGTIFSVTVKFLAGTSRRVEVFAATAGFFAVASVFVSDKQ